VVVAAVLVPLAQMDLVHNQVLAAPVWLLVIQDPVFIMQAVAVDQVLPMEI
jgi:hypothetical protein